MFLGITIFSFLISDEQYSGMTLMDKVDPLPEPASHPRRHVIRSLFLSIIY